jgi:hypothetical protein
MKNEKTKIPFEVMERFAKRNGISITDSIMIHDSLIVYLDAAAESKKSLSPNKLQDEAWHSFMLHSKEYSAFCRERYGFFIHHVPTSMEEDVLAVKVKLLLRESAQIKKTENKDCHGGDCKNSLPSCGKHLCGSDYEASTKEVPLALMSLDCYNSCSNGSCGNSNCNSDGDAAK